MKKYKFKLVFQLLAGATIPVDKLGCDKIEIVGDRAEFYFSKTVGDHNETRMYEKVVGFVPQCIFLHSQWIKV